MFGPAGETLLVLQDERVHYAGQPVAVVVAGTFEAARHAASLVNVTYAEEKAVATLYDATDARFASELAPPDVVASAGTGPRSL